MKILNLYSCLGGNRYKWDEVADEAGIKIEVTAVELDPEAARLYQERFPNDKVIVADAHKYLIEHYQEFSEGLVWSSPPCPTHSRARFWGFGVNGKNPTYPDMKLYEEIIFLQHHCKGKYVVENVIPYYEPMITPIKRGRHLFWTNFKLPNILSERNFSMSKEKKEVEKLIKFHDYDFKLYKGNQRTDKIARNLVDYEVGKTILETVVGIVKKKDQNQINLF